MIRLSVPRVSDPRISSRMSFYESREMLSVSRRSISCRGPAASHGALRIVPHAAGGARRGF
jgi:hypothetical protein